MDFPDSFRNHILPEHIHMLNVCFVVDELKKNFGGTAGNIAYTMNLLGCTPSVLAPIGTDGKEYLDHFISLGISTQYIRPSQKFLTASAHIMTDKDNNQLTAFYNGACQEADTLSISEVKEKPSFVILSPNYKHAMIRHAKECMEQGIPFCFDPGQQLTAFSSQELMLVIGQAHCYIVNDYEMKLTTEKTGWSTEDMLDHVDMLIITLGENGSVIVTKEQTFEISSCPPRSVDDPTGAGDAYRAGFFSAYTQGHDLQTCGQVGSLAATYAIEHYGTQHHTFTSAEFIERYKEVYKEPITLTM